MEQRAQQLLLQLINVHIETAQPVASGLLAQSTKLNLSPATIRNELAVLEKEGYITQPHTSAGRVPTERGYEVYREVEAVIGPDQEVREELKIVLEGKDARSELKGLAKTLAEHTGEAIYVAFGAHDTYYTGLSNLFGKEEFKNHDLVSQLSKVIDHLDDTLATLDEQLGSTPETKIGSKSGFGKGCSTIIMRYTYNDQKGIMGILSPIRANYPALQGLMEYLHSELN